MSGICVTHWQKCLKNRFKKVFPLARKSVALSKKKVIFQKLDLPADTNRTKISK